jgi:hypothetical protein
MLLDKIDYLKLQSCQADTLAITAEFRRALLKHFEIVDIKSTNLINSRWEDEVVA